MTRYAGIDPGKTGAIAIFDSETHIAQVWDCGLPQEMATVVGTLCPFDHAAIEAVHSMPGQGVRSVFSFGENYGTWQGLLAGHHVPYQLVSPQKWKKEIGLAVRADKTASREMAARFFPELAHQLTRVKDDGRAEALLICAWLKAWGNGAKEWD